MTTNIGLVALLFSALGTGAVVAKDDFECLIAAEHTAYAVGDSPGFKLQILNKTNKDVMLIVPLDGSESSMRYPRCGLEVFDASGKPLKPRTRFRCGNMNPLRVENFVEVPAGHVFEPYGGGLIPMLQYFPFDITAPGEYTFRFYYANSEHVWDYFGDERLGGRRTATPEIQRRFERVPVLNVKSNDLKIRFMPKAKRS